MIRAVSPRSLAEAVRWLQDEPSLVPVAGCTDFMVREPEERLRVAGLLDLLRIGEIRGIRPLAGGGLEIGATTTFTALGRSPEVRERFPALAAAAAVVGGWQVQNRATLGGNVVNASPAGDSLPVLLALDATAVAVGPRGEREIPYARLHTGYRSLALARGELLAWLRLPLPPPGSVQLFRKVGTREAQAISKVVVALVARLESGSIDTYRLAAGSVAPTPVRFGEVERALLGRSPGEAAAGLAGRLAAQSVEPIDDLRSTAEYRREVLGRVVRRLTLEIAAGGSPGVSALPA